MGKMTEKTPNKNNQQNLWKKVFGFLLIIAGVICFSYLFTSTCQPGEACATGHNITGQGFWAFTLAALTDSINPCALAVLLILLEGLVLIRKRIVITGLSFVFGIFLSYLLIGLGLISGLNLIQNADLFHLIVALIAILVGILNVKDYFWYGKWFRMEIPIKWRPRMGQILSQATGPLIALLAGILVSFFELPCTGGPYLFALGILKGETLLTTTLPYLLYYNLIFVLPLILIILAVHFSYLKIEKTEKWRKKNIKLLHLLAGIIMIGLGSWLFFTSI